MIRHPELAIGFGVFGVVFGAALLVLLARRARRAKKLRAAARRPELRQAPPSGAGTPDRGGRVYRGLPVRDVEQTAFVPQVRGDGRG